MSGENDIFDYVRGGCRHRGCVVASRLAEDPKVRVALIEAGPDHSHPFIHIPATVGAAIWHAEAQLAIHDRRPSRT